MYEQDFDILNKINANILETTSKDYKSCPQPEGYAIESTANQL